MSYVTQQTTDIAKAQVAEALLRMKKLNIHENAIREFEDEGKLNLSEGVRIYGARVGVLYWLNDEERKMVKAWEEETGCMVYHVIKNYLKDGGCCYSFLYVSKDVDEWGMDNEDLEEGTPYAYVKNVPDDWCSEIGRIGVEPAFGGVVRVA